MNTIHNKFYIWYMNIVTTAQHMGRSKKEGVYYEGHHIIPRSLGGDNKKSNIVLLTPKEHLICHMLLPRFLEGKEKGKMIWALHRLTYNGTVRTSGQYELVRKQHSDNQSKPKSEATKEKMRKPKSDEHRLNMSKAQQRRKEENYDFSRTPESIQNYTKTMNIRYPDGVWYGRRHTDESRKKMSESHKGAKASVETRALLSELRKGEKNVMFGKNHTDETREKMRLAWIIRRQKMNEVKLNIRQN